MGLGDKFNNTMGTIAGALANKPASSAPVNGRGKDQGDFIRSSAGTTSGLDAAMQAHADEKHPVAKRKVVYGADWDQ